jgi:hypothetical protein
VDPDPDPAFQVNPDTADTYPDPIWIQGFDDQKLKKKIQLKYSRRSLQPSKENIEHFKK